MGHRAELGGYKGRWPMKECKIVLKCLKSAIANAREKGLSTDLIVSHVCANKRHSYSRYASKGRRNVSKLETARVEIVLREKHEAKRKRVDEQKKAAEAKPAAAQAKEKKPAPTAPAAQTTASGAAAGKAAPTAAAAPTTAAPKEIKPKPDVARPAAAKPAAAKPAAPAAAKAEVAKKKEVA